MASGDDGGSAVYNDPARVKNRKNKEAKKWQEGRPAAPVWQGANRTNMGKLLDPSLQSTTAIDTRGLEGVRNEALRTGPSAWRGLMEQQQGNRYAGLTDQLSRQSAGSMAQAQSQAAMRGGLGGGSAERLAQQSMQGRLMGQQGLSRQRQGEAIGLDVQDEQNRQGMLQNLPGMEQGYAQAKSGLEQANIQNALRQLTEKRGFDLGKYNEAMRAWGAQKTAEATKPEGKG